MKSTLKNDLLLRAARGEKIERPPVWLMRQAGRILPQYRALRGKLANFKVLLKKPDAVCEVTLQPVDELGVDAAIIFSDILVVCEAMGLDYNMVEKRGPVFPTTIQTLTDIENLKISDGNNGVPYTIEAIKITKKALNGRVPLIGFSGCPWTLFAYMVEGSGSKTFWQARRMLYTEPEASHLLLQKLTTTIINYLKDQIVAGVDIIQLFDSWAGILTPEQYRIFALPYIQQICDAITEVPKIVFAKNAYFALPEIGKLNCEVVGVDWNMNPKNVRKQVGKRKALQGNLDPCLLFADPKTVEAQTLKMLQSFGNQGHIANLGHGVYPQTPLDNVKTFVNTVQNYRY